MTKNLLNLPVADGSESATRRLVAGARKVLELATTNNERMATREKAERMKAAAEALGWREIATECSIIMMDAERLIVKSTDLKKSGPKVGAKGSLDADQTTEPEDQDGPDVEIIEPDQLDRQALYDMRRGHARMTDAQYADLRDEARTSGSILTRKRVIDRAKQLNQGDEDAQSNQESAPATRKKPNTKAPEESKAPPATSEASLRKRIADLEAQVETLEERCAILSESGDATTIEERFNNQAAVITAMRNENAILQKRLDASELRCQLQADRIKELVEKYAVEEVDPKTVKAKGKK